MASPLYSASTLLRSMMTNARVEGGGGGTAGFHPRMVPLSVENRNTDGPWSPPCLTTKSLLPLYTVPVGAPGTFTVSGTFEPSPMYSVDVFVPLLATHQGEDGLSLTPHALTRSLS